MKRKIIVVFCALLVVSIIADISDSGIITDGFIDRDVLGGEEKEVDLNLEIGDYGKEYEYFLNVLPTLPKEEEAREYFQDAIAEIDKDFEQIEDSLMLRDKYADGLVGAEWSFQPFGIINENGDIYFDKVEKEGSIIQAQVELSCGTYIEIYTFSFALKPPSLSKEERIFQEIKTKIEKQMQLEGSQKIQLPTEVEGEEIRWFEEREYLTPQVLILELLAFVLIQIASKRKVEEEEKKRLLEMEKDYPDIVNQLSLLLGVGMTTRQAWARIASQYEYKRKEGLQTKRTVYEAILQMNRRLKDGESERLVYKRFMEEIPLASYRKLVRLLLGNLEKGTSGIALRLEEESRLAFEQKILQTKKLGEEASTKMLLPLMLMLMLVMGVVILPALLKFKL